MKDESHSMEDLENDQSEIDEHTQLRGGMSTSTSPRGAEEDEENVEVRRFEGGHTPN